MARKRLFTNILLNSSIPIPRSYLQDFKNIRNYFLSMPHYERIAWLNYVLTYKPNIDTKDN